MEGESTLGVLSGFVLGALTFHHLNTDSDTVSRARLPTPSSLRVRGPGRLSLLSSGLYLLTLGREVRLGGESRAAFLPRYPALRGIPASVPTRSERAPPESGGRPRCQPQGVGQF